MINFHNLVYNYNKHNIYHISIFVPSQGSNENDDEYDSIYGTYMGHMPYKGHTIYGTYDITGFE